MADNDLSQLLQDAIAAQAEETGDPTPLLTRYVAVVEFTDGDSRWLSVSATDSITAWEVEGMLRSAIRYAYAIEDSDNEPDDD